MSKASLELLSLNYMSHLDLMNNSSFIHPLRDSFTGLSVGFPALT